MEQQEQPQKSKRLKIVIIILAVLLVISAGGLAARYLYLAYFVPAQSTAAVPDNLIGAPASSAPTDESRTPAADESQPEPTGTSSSPAQPAETDKPTAAKLVLYEGQPSDNQRFEVSNMLPGDIETKYFCVKAYHDKDVDLFFKTEITEQTKNLGDVLHIKVTHLDSGNVLCDAPFSEIGGKEFSELLKVTGEKITTAYYQVEVSLDTAVGNEYQAAQLRADFSWFVKDEGGLTPPPQTGDTTNLTLWIVLAVSSLLLIVLLRKRRKEDERLEQA